MKSSAVCISRNPAPRTPSGECRALDVPRCLGDKCKFLKTRKQVEDEIAACYRRLRTLRLSEQQEIARKYYGGTMPWQA
jgi:hypothetical protein